VFAKAISANTGEKAFYIELEMIVYGEILVLFYAGSKSALVG
jgi:hypothetical protein